MNSILTCSLGMNGYCTVYTVQYDTRFQLAYSVATGIFISFLFPLLSKINWKKKFKFQCKDI